MKYINDLWREKTYNHFRFSTAVSKNSAGTDSKTKAGISVFTHHDHTINNDKSEIKNTVPNQ